MNFGGLSENNNFNHNHVSATTTDLHPEDIANPDKLKHEIQYYDRNVYINNDNDNDSDNEYQPDDHTGNYTNGSDQQDENYDENNDKNHDDKKNVHEDKSDVSDKSETNYHHSHSKNETECENTKNESKFNPDDESTWTKEEIMLQKLELLRKLGELSKAGVKLSQNYSLASDYKTMKFEYELHSNIRSKQNSIKWMSGMLVGIVKGMELLNDNMNPFDMKFDSMWSNDVQSDISSYYDILGEIYEKYTTPGKKMAPELRLFLMLTGSAVSIQMHKGIANFMASKSDVSGELEDDPNKFAELRRKSDMKRDEQKRKMQEKINEEHNMATAKMANINFLKEKEKAYNDAKKNTNNINFNSMILSEQSAKSSKKDQNKMKQYAQMDMIEKKMEQQMKSKELNEELQNLANIRNMIQMRKEKENENVNVNNNLNNNTKRTLNAKKIESSSQSKNENTSVTTSSRGKTKNEDCSISVASSASYSIKNPRFQNMKNSANTAESASSVRKIATVDKDDVPEITMSRSKDSGNKSKGKAKKISTK